MAISSDLRSKKTWPPGGGAASAREAKTEHLACVFWMVSSLLDWAKREEQILPETSTAMMNLFLEQVSQTFPTHFIVMQVDQAGWHRSQELRIPANIRLVSQPAYSPELNPVEHIWDELREK